ncbi:hypothetical protein SpCBS45565_g03716 [Spizellomyces sp. 'palustris']|nr:hypothetical protein SpCBS45565_g03716 [Spizellomyces sp. 'palustris']
MDLSICKFLDEHVLFKDLHDEDFLMTLANSMQTRVYYDNSYVIRQGEVGRALFFVFRGDIEVVSEDGETVINIMKEKSFFGEIGVLFSVPRTASCRARGRCVVLTLTRESLAMAIQRHPEVATAIRYIAEERFASYMKQRESSMLVEFGEELKLGMTQNDLKKIPAFRDCEVGFLHMLALSLCPLQYCYGDVIIRKDDIACEMYFVVRGTAEVFSEEDGQTFAEFHPGSFFGEVGIFFHVRRTASVRCTSNQMAVFKLAKNDLDTLLKQYPEVNQKIQEEAQLRFKFNEEREKSKLNKRQAMQLELEVVRERLKTVPLFKDGSLAFFHELVLVLKLHVYPPGSVIIRKDEVARSMFFVMDGTVQVVSEDGKSIYAEMGANAFFGEVALFYEINRTATVRSKSQTTLYELSNDALSHVLGQHPTLKETMEARAEENYRLFQKRTRAVNQLSETSLPEAYDIDATAARLKKVPIFKNCVNGFLRTVALTTSVCSRKAGELIVHKGEVSAEMFFIVHGKVQIISEDGSTVYDAVKEGGFFGEIGLLRGIPRTASVRVASKSCGMMILTAEALQKVFQQYPESYHNIVLEADKRFRLIEQRKLTTEGALHAGVDTDTIQRKAREIWDTAVDSVKADIREKAKMKARASDRDESQPQQLRGVRRFLRRGSKVANENVPVRNENETGPPGQAEQSLMIVEQEKATSRHEKTSDVPKTGVRWIGKLFQGFKSSSSKRRERGVKVAPEGPSSRRGSDASYFSRASTIVQSSPNTTEEQSIADLEERALRIIFSCLNPLERLKMRLMCKRWNELLRNPIQWTTLDFSPLFSTITHKTLTSFWELTGDHLTRLCLQTCWRVTDRDLETLAALCPNIYYLSLSNCWRFTDKGLRYLTRNLTRVVEADLSYCGQLKGSGFARHKWSKLKKLDLSYCKAIGDEQVEKILSGTSEITHLQLRRCMKMTDLSMFHVVRYCRHIRYLDLSDCEKLTDRCLNWIGSTSFHLTTLILSFCKRLTNHGVRELQMGSQRLEHLDFSHCEHLTDDAIKFLTENISNLRYISLRFCRGMTNRTASYLGGAALRLKSVDFTGCPEVTIAARDMLKSMIPGVHVLLDSPRPLPEINRRATEAQLYEVFLSGPRDQMRKREIRRKRQVAAPRRLSIVQ